MLIVISPAKSLDFATPPVIQDYTIPDLLPESAKLAGRLKAMNPKQLSALMDISADLGNLNFKRYQEWQTPFTPENAKQAILAFNGDVYQGLDAATLSEEKLLFSQNKLRILSGLYGVLKPLDLIQPYRLEMGTKLKYHKSKDLYEFWGHLITKKINEAVSESGSGVLINLASNEYFKSIDRKKLKAEIVRPDFKDFKNGSYKMISFFAKRARGLMTRFILENKITEPSDLLAFNFEGYSFNSRLSKPGNPVFTREQ
jgi:cytoplasmic iron level regulating protein YaaA (DUF328/UPF0246 family)